MKRANVPTRTTASQTVSDGTYYGANSSPAPRVFLTPRSARDRHHRGRDRGQELTRGSAQASNMYRTGTSCSIAESTWSTTIDSATARSTHRPGTNHQLVRRCSARSPKDSSRRERSFHGPGASRIIVRDRAIHTPAAAFHVLQSVTFASARSALRPLLRMSITWRVGCIEVLHERTFEPPPTGAADGKHDAEPVPWRTRHGKRAPVAAAGQALRRRAHVPRVRGPWACSRRARDRHRNVHRPRASKSSTLGIGSGVAAVVRAGALVLLAAVLVEAREMICIARRRPA